MFKRFKRLFGDWVRRADYDLLVALAQAVQADRDMVLGENARLRDDLARAMEANRLVNKIMSEQTARLYHLQNDLAASEALLYESEALRVATVEKLQAVEAERDDARQRLGRAFEAVYNPADPPWANTSH